MMQRPEESSSMPGREYQHLMRGPRFAWWRPLIVFLLVIAFLLLVTLLVGGGFLVAGRDFSQAVATQEMTVPVFALTNLLLAALIPIAMLSMRIAYGENARLLSSVAGGLRWQWMGLCIAIMVPIFVVCVGLGLLMDWPQSPRPAQWALLLLMVVVGTPLQAAGEEYVFRGLVLQNVGAWFRGPRIGMLVATAVSTVIFAFVHGSSDPWIVLDLGVGSIACCILVWRTGGLEAAIVLHAINNVAGMGASLVFGGWGEDFVRPTSEGRPIEPLMTLLVSSAVVALVLRRARQSGIARTYQPAADESAGSNPVPRRAGIFWLPRIAVAAVVVIMNLWAMGSGLPRLESTRLPKLRYADIAKPMGVGPDGCLRNNRILSLPLEIRRYASQELVEDDVQLTLGDVVITGRNGVFQFPLSAQLMAENPDFRVVQPDGRTIDFRYRFVSSTVQSSGDCEPSSR
jgi:membrane protease YdiL (CAAX protease family)